MGLTKHMQCMVTGEMAEALEIIQKKQGVKDSRLLNMLLREWLVKNKLGEYSEFGFRIIQEELDKIRN